MLRDLIVGPHQISFDITNKCNLRCLHCYNSSGENLASQNELTDQEVLDFIDEFKSIKLLNFCFCTSSKGMSLQAGGNYHLNDADPVVVETILPPVYG